MKTAMSVVLCLSLGLVLAGGTVNFAFAHCEIPCGIYNDQMRVVMIAEDVKTIEKSMTEIERLSQAGDKNYNQLVRWINNKDSHAEKIQEVVYQYFMTQRVKLVDKADKAAQQKYMAQLAPLHEMLVYAMKCKQTTDLDNCKKLLASLDAFKEAYFNKEDLDHLNEHHGEKKEEKMEHHEHKH